MKIQDILGLYRRAKESMRVIENSEKAEGKNLSCGDEVTLYFRIKDNRLDEISFLARGCAISTTSAYLLTQRLKGKSVDEVLSMSDEDYLRLIGMQDISPQRIKCALLPFITLKRTLKGFSDFSTRGGPC